MPANPLCFVAMPFLPEFNYFYLCLQKYLGEHHQLQVERGDHRILTKPLIDKVREQIRGAHILIADISGANPNVLYEVGLAHAYGKPVLFLTQDPPEQAPVEIAQVVAGIVLPVLGELRRETGERRTMQSGHEPFDHRAR